MAASDGKGDALSSLWNYIPTITAILTSLAIAAGSWGAMGSRIDDLRSDNRDQESDIRGHTAKLAEAVQRISVLESQVSYLDRIVTELRRQANLKQDP